MIDSINTFMSVLPLRMWVFWLYVLLLIHGFFMYKIYVKLSKDNLRIMRILMEKQK